MSDFKGRHFGGEIVLWAVRWYCRYPISYRDLGTMMTERGVSVDNSTIDRWVQHFAPEMERRLRWRWRWPRSRSWRIDETYVKVRGKWAYLYGALDKLGNTIDFYPSATRNTKAAKRFLGKALGGLKDWELPEVLNTDKAPTCAAAIAELEAVREVPDRDEAPAGQVPQQRHRGRPRQARAADPAGARIQDADDGLRHDQGLRGDARAAQRPSRDVRPPRWHCRRGSDRRARLRRRTVRPDRGHGMATGPSGQRTNMTQARLSSRSDSPLRQGCNRVLVTTLLDPQGRNGTLIQCHRISLCGHRCSPPRPYTNPTSATQP